MDEKSLATLEYPKILERLAGYCDFSASAELARALRPTADLEDARRRLAETSEARQVLAAHSATSVGGARDVRPQVEAAARNVVLVPGDLLDIKATLASARTLGRTLARQADTHPCLAEIAAGLPPAMGLVDAITRAISDRGEVLDSASEKLAAIRRELRVSHERLLSRLERMVASPQIAPFLQEALVTQRDGRYVLPLRVEFKGRVKAIVHDRSASGATLFVEPLAVVDLNNRYREMQLAERDEQRRVLADLSRRVGDHAEGVRRAVEVLAALDLAFARARYAEALEAEVPVLRGIRRTRSPRGEQTPHPGSTIRLWQARHPLLDPRAVVPIDVALDSRTYAMVITGPNTGGKTVTLKTVGLLALMAQSGLHIPAQAGSELSVFEAVYADIGDEQSIEQSLSTFSGHITTIIGILERAGPRSLVILDELGAGTDPQEGAALAQAILSTLLERGVTTLVATHYPELKAYAHAAPGVVNASAEFDLETLRPTYHLTVGLPGRSNALAIARRLGLPEAIVAAARQELSPADLRVEDLLDEIHRQRDLAREARAGAEKARREAEALRAELAARLESIEEERQAVLDAAREAAAAQLADLQEALDALRRDLARARKPLETLEPAEDRLEELQEQLQEQLEALSPPDRFSELPGRGLEARPIRAGDRVRLRTLGTQGVVGALGEEHAEVHVGNLRVRTRLADLELLDAAGEQAPEPAGREAPALSPAEGPVSAPRAESPGVELDLRGQRVDEALDALDRYLDAAYLAGLSFVRLIHGKGTGRLRDAIRQELRRHPHVASLEAGHPDEGGEGVTVVKLKPS